MNSKQELWLRMDGWENTKTKTNTHKEYWYKGLHHIFIDQTDNQVWALGNYEDLSETLKTLRGLA